MTEHILPFTTVLSFGDVGRGQEPERSRDLYPQCCPQYEVQEGTVLETRPTHGITLRISVELLLTCVNMS